MRSYVPEFDLVAASDLAQVLDYVARGYQPLAGGTDLMVLFNAGKLRPASLVCIRTTPELRGIAVRADVIEIGAAVTYSELREHNVVARDFPLLAQSASWTGSIANQNRGTLGGNIANASPAADSSPVLLAYGADLKLVSSSGERWIPYSEFHLGYKALSFQKGELIAAVRLPRTKYSAQYGRKVGTRKAMAISKVSFAATVSQGQFRIAVGSVAPMPVRCLKTEQLLSAQRVTATLIDEAMEMISQEITPISDIRSTSDYRTLVTQNLLAEFLESLL
jgi:CO/xanthine dehydrogenase FAD-binding subunit